MVVLHKAEVSFVEGAPLCEVAAVEAINHKDVFSVVVNSDASEGVKACSAGTMDVADSAWDDVVNDVGEVSQSQQFELFGGNYGDGGRYVFLLCWSADTCGDRFGFLLNECEELLQFGGFLLCLCEDVAVADE